MRTNKLLSVINKMPRIFKFIALAIPVLSFGVFTSYRDYVEPERAAFEGRVSYIEWQSKNHRMPLIGLKRSNGTKVKFSSNRIILDSSQLEVGDLLSKESGSKICKINGKALLCIK
jgi:hypothetical protein